MNNLKKYTFRFLMVAFLMGTAQQVHSQIIFDDDVDDGISAPIDGFVALGMAAGAYLGYRRHQKKQS